MTSEKSNLLSPRSHNMKLRIRHDQKDSTENQNETEQLLPSDGHTFAKEPLKVVNMGLAELRAARGTATRRMRTVKKAWGTFKAKMRPAIRQNIKPQQLWSITATLSSPHTPSTRRLMINSPLTGDDFATPDDHRQYRPAHVGTPLTPLTPVDNLRRSARIASRTPTPLRDQDSNARQTRRRATPKRIKLNASPGRFLRDLNSLTNQFNQQLGKGSFSTGVGALEAMSTNLSNTINKQDSRGTLPEIPIVKPATMSKQPAQSKENEPEPSRLLRLRRNRGVFVSRAGSEGQMLTECFE